MLLNLHSSSRCVIPSPMQIRFVVDPVKRPGSRGTVQVPLSVTLSCVFRDLLPPKHNITVFMAITHCQAQRYPAEGDAELVLCPLNRRPGCHIGPSNLAQGADHPPSTSRRRISMRPSNLSLLILAGFCFTVSQALKNSNGGGILSTIITTLVPSPTITTVADNPGAIVWRAKCAFIPAPYL